MLLSVIIVGYNGEMYLRHCLESVLDQTLPSEAYEVIYFDNNSSDQSVALVEDHFPTVQIIQNPKNLGYYGGFNHAAETAASGKYLLALPQDTILHRACLQELAQAADSASRMMVGLVNTINPPAQEFQKKDRDNWPDHVYWCSTNRLGQTNLTQRPLFTAPLPILAYSGVAALVRRDAKEHLTNYFDERLSHLVGDSELGIRANVLNYHCYLIPTAVVFHIEDNKQFGDLGFLRRAFEAARDSVIIYYKLMHTLEFVLFSPLLMIGQASKVFTLRFPLWQRAILFVPALLLSPLTFLLALFRTPAFSASRQDILARRQNEYFWLLKTIVCQHLH